MCGCPGHGGQVWHALGAGSEASGPNNLGAGSEASGPNKLGAGSEASGPSIPGAGSEASGSFDHEPGSIPSRGAQTAVCSPSEPRSSTQRRDRGRDAGRLRARRGVR
ncbi:hypothetical protein CA982_24285 [Gordonia lacunae]|uniref:Uncharacterized protein n=1 Tax=Gordonia lacunae TaxID=417102 RepID=A0A243Q3T2_9ACTN|nr:hypothetical protein CA982_24285 [Gordonia lacunae]